MDDTLIYHKKYGTYDMIKEDKQLTYLLQLVKHPKYVYTNATYSHANVIANKLKIDHLFTKIYSRDTIPTMKPDINSAIALEKDIQMIHPQTYDHMYYFFDDLFYMEFFIHCNKDCIFIFKSLFIFCETSFSSLIFNFCM